MRRGDSQQQGLVACFGTPLPLRVLDHPDPIRLHEASAAPMTAFAGDDADDTLISYRSYSVLPQPLFSEFGLVLEAQFDGITTHSTSHFRPHPRSHPSTCLRWLHFRDRVGFDEASFPGRWFFFVHSLSDSNPTLEPRFCPTPAFL